MSKIVWAILGLNLKDVVLKEVKKFIIDIKCSYVVKEDENNYNLRSWDTPLFERWLKLFGQMRKLKVNGGVARGFNYKNTINNSGKHFSITSTYVFLCQS